MKSTKLANILAISLLISFGSSAYAQTKIVFWDFFGGGDGVRMKQIVDDYNKNQKEVHVERTTLPWGAPFYTKIHTAVVAGETPDVMTYHLSHFSAGLAANDLRPITQAELATVDLKAEDFQPNLVERQLEVSKDQNKGADLHAVPLDTHTAVIYYNKDILNKVGLLDANGKPSFGTGIEDFTKALKTIKEKSRVIPLSFGSQDQATVWRLWYTLFIQQDGKLANEGKLDAADLDSKGKIALEQVVDWSKDGLISKNTTYSAMVALFSAGRAALMFNGNWEVPTVVDLKAQNKLGFDYGVMACPKFYANQNTFADSHLLAIPNNTKKPISPEKLAATLKFIAYVEKNALAWAGGGHIAAYLPVQTSEAYKNLVPNNEYTEEAAKNATLEPKLTPFGVGGPVYDAVGNTLMPSLNGKLGVSESLGKFKEQLSSFSK